MEPTGESVRIYELDKYNYPQFRDKLIELYLHAFTTGDYGQCITRGKVEATLDELLRDGYGWMAFAADCLMGLVVTLPLEKDPGFPAGMCPTIPVEQSVYIAEVMVHADYRGRGIASEMLESCLRNEAKNHLYAVIRVWEKNKPALELYRKLGFLPIAGIVQKKLGMDGEEFEMKKLYLAKEWKGVGLGEREKGRKGDWEKGRKGENFEKNSNESINYQNN
ncbi:N-acetyltransferase [Proteiniphilum sp.]|uniref:GNAT family N-acetyltransferase n=1 Tax=Proteiniphilum sp. TaxID=1926877 RepID=UPI00332A675D